jgi:hypothetical protein
VLSKGYPLAFTTANTSALFNATERPNSTGVAAVVPGGRNKDQMMAEYFTTNVFAMPAAFTLGNAPGRPQHHGRQFHIRPNQRPDEQPAPGPGRTEDKVPT